MRQRRNQTLAALCLLLGITLIEAQATYRSMPGAVVEHHHETTVLRRSASGSLSSRYCGVHPLSDRDLCCDGYYYPNPHGHFDCCGSGFYNMRSFGCDGFTTFMLQSSSPSLPVLQKVYQRVLPMNYYCGAKYYDPKDEYCCGCCTNEHKIILKKGDSRRLCCWGFTHANDDGNQACCGEKSYDTRFYMCTPQQEVIARRADILPFAPTDYCDHKSFNPETHYCCGVKIVAKSSDDLCCNGYHFVNPKHAHLACCCNNVFDTRSQICEKCTVAPLPRPGPTPIDYCADTEYNPESQFCCGTTLVTRNTDNFLCCNGVYYGEVDRTLQCCHTNIYDTRYHRCHGRHIIKLEPPSLDIVRNVRLPRYCGGVVPGEMVSKDDLCCKGIYFPNQRNSLACCGPAAYDVHHHFCSPDNIIVQMPVGGPLGHRGPLGPFPPPPPIAAIDYSEYVDAPVAYTIPGQPVRRAGVAVVSGLLPTHRAPTPGHNIFVEQRNLVSYGNRKQVTDNFVADGQFAGPPQPRQLHAAVSHLTGDLSGPIFGPTQQRHYQGDPKLFPIRAHGPNKLRRFSPHGGVVLNQGKVVVSQLEPKYAPRVHPGPDQKIQPMPNSALAPGRPDGPLCDGYPYDPEKFLCCAKKLWRRVHDVFQMCCGDVYHTNQNKNLNLVCCGTRAVHKGYDTDCY